MQEMGWMVDDSEDDHRSHHHKPRGSSLRMPATRPELGSLLGGAEGMLFAIRAAVHLKVVVAENFAAILLSTLASLLFSISVFLLKTDLASEAAGMEFLLQFRFQILALDAAIARLAQRTV